MAIPFCRVTVVSAAWSAKTAKGKLREGPAGRSKRKPGSAVGAEAYISRTRRKNLRTGKWHDHRYRSEKQDKDAGGDDEPGKEGKRRWGPTHDVLRSGLMLPPGADPKFEDPSYLWSEAECAELVTVRKTGKRRFRQGAELARHFVIALPNDRPLAELVELTEEFAKLFVAAGLAVSWAIHPGEDHATGNTHAHLLVTSRAIEGAKFSKYRSKAFTPRFCVRKGKGYLFVSRQSGWPQIWQDFQNRFFAERGIPIRVDPISVSPRLHEGPTRRRKGNRKTADNRAIAKHEAKVLRDPAALLQRMTERSAVFGLTDLARVLRKAGISGMEAGKIIRATVFHPDCVALDAPLPKGFRDSARSRERCERFRFTTRTVLEQERRLRENMRRIVDDWSLIRRLPPDALNTAEGLIRERELDVEQANSVRYCLQSDGLAQVQGKAGTGKSYAAIVVHDALRDAHYNVIGAAPTNAVAGNLRKDGFKQAMTLHRLLMLVECGKIKLDSLHVLMVDEAAMANVDLFDRLFAAAATSGCHVMLIGDDKQLPPIGRGGAYSLVGRLLGQIELKNVRRQKVAWMRNASIDLSRWDIGPAIQAYNRHGAVTWTQSLEAATRQLVEDWGQACDKTPDKTVFVYAGTNNAVNDLNRRLQRRRWRGRRDPVPHAFTCCRGDVEVRVGDRLQFHANDPAKGIYNGTLATVSAIDNAGIHVDMDDGNKACFDPAGFADWALGYAGTCYRGQGKTQDRVFLLYDHPFVWGAATTYVGLSRHREHAQLYVPRELAVNEAALIRQMSRSTEQTLATDLVEADPVRARHDIMSALDLLEPPALLNIRRADGKRQVVDLTLAPARAAATAHFKRAGVKEFVVDYNKLDALARSGPEHSQAEMVRRGAASAAWRRGFKPSTGLMDPTCLQHNILEKDREYLYDDPLDRLSGKEDGSIDLRWIAFRPDQVPYRPFFDMAWRIRQLDEFVQDGIIERLNKLGRMFGTDEVFSAVLMFATYLVKISKAIRHAVRGKSYPKLRSAASSEVGADRLVWRPFMLLNGKGERMVALHGSDKDEINARTASIESKRAPAAAPVDPDLRRQRWESRDEVRARQEVKAGSAGGARGDARQAGGRGSSTTRTQPASPTL